MCPRILLPTFKDCVAGVAMFAVSVSVPVQWSRYRNVGMQASVARLGPRVITSS